MSNQPEFFSFFHSEIRESFQSLRRKEISLWELERDIGVIFTEFRDKLITWAQVEFAVYDSSSIVITVQRRYEVPTPMLALPEPKAVRRLRELEAAKIQAKLDAYDNRQMYELPNKGGIMF